MREGWTYKKLGEVATFINGYPFKPSDWKDCGRRIIRIQNLNNPKALYNYYDGEIDAKYLVSNGDVLISWSGSLGVFEWSEDEAILNQHIFKVVFNKGDINKRFFEYVVSSRINEMKTKVHGITMQHITKRDFDVIPIPVPPLSEQQRIVSELDLLSSIIEKKKAQLREYDLLAQSIFYDMFGDPVTNEKGWEVKRLENVVSDNCSISYGIVQPGDDVENGVPVVRPIDLVNRIVKCKGLKVVEKSISDSYKRTILNGNELLLCVRGTTGVMSFASSDLKGCNVTRGITPLSFNERVEKQYVYYLFKSSFIQSIIAEKTRGIALKQINMKDVRELPILIPPLPLQQSFASKIEAIERQKALVQQSITETETLFNSRMDYWFA